MAERVASYRTTQKGPFAAAAQQGSELPFALIGQSQLASWQTIRDRDALEADAAQRHREEMELRHAISDARRAGWSDTVEGHAALKVHQREQRLREEEERRLRIDAEEAALAAARRQVAMSQADSALRARDERVMKLNSALLQHQVIQEREEQKVLSARRAELKQQRDEAFHKELMAHTAAQLEAEKQRAREAREQSAAAREACRLQLEEIKADRRLQKQEADEEGRRLRELAEIDAEQQRMERLDLRHHARDIQYQNIKSIGELPIRTTKCLSPRSPASKKETDSPSSSRGRQPSPPEGGGGGDRDFIEMKMQFLRKQKELADRAAEARTLRTELVAASLPAYSSPRKAIPETWHAQSPSMSQRLCDGDEQRVSAREYLKEAMRTDLDRQAEMATLQRSARSTVEQRQRALLDARIQALEEEDRQAKVAEKIENIRLRQIQLLQQRQRNESERTMFVRNLEEERFSAQQRAAEEEAMRQYLESQLPPDMPPGVAKGVFRFADRQGTSYY